MSRASSPSPRWLGHASRRSPQRWPSTGNSCRSIRRWHPRDVGRDSGRGCRAGTLPLRWVHDFILGVRYVDGSGEVVRAGGKVVDAAGFDIPKLMVGSLGQLGVLVGLTFKVFPAAGGVCYVAGVVPLPGRGPGDPLPADRLADGPLLPGPGTGITGRSVADPARWPGRCASRPARAASWTDGRRRDPGRAGQHGCLAGCDRVRPRCPGFVRWSKCR